MWEYSSYIPAGHLYAHPFVKDIHHTIGTPRSSFTADISVIPLKYLDETDLGDTLFGDVASVDRSNNSNCKFSVLSLRLDGHRAALSPLH